MSAPIQIRRDDVVRDIRELAAITHQPITEAVAAAVRAELAKARASRSLDERRAAVEDIVRRFSELPLIGAPLTDADLYDEDGLPK